MNYKDLVYLDIETVGKYENLESLKYNDVRGYNLFMRKIDRKSSQYLDWKDDPNVVYFNKAPLMPEFGKIVCVSIANIKEVDGIDEQKLVSVYSHDEKTIINKVQKIFTNVSNKTLLGLCGFYIKGFDIPWLNRKTLQHGLKIPKILKTFNVKPWEMNIVDLADVWKSFGTLENVSFDEMLYALDIKSPKNIMAGKDVHNNYWFNNDLEKIKDYCEADVKSCIEAAKKIIHNV